MSNQPATVDEASLQQLAGLIRYYFRHAEGRRGKNCVVEPCRRGELDYFFAYPEDYSQQSLMSLWLSQKYEKDFWVCYRSFTNDG